MATKKQEPKEAPEMTRESFEALFGGGFENVEGEAGVRTNGHLTTSSANDACTCIKGKVFCMAASWADVARKMKVS
jgi:hypothetical protein